MRETELNARRARENRIACAWVTAVLLPVAALMAIPYFSAKPHESSWRRETPEERRLAAVQNTFLKKVYGDIKVEDVALAKADYAAYMAKYHFEGFLSEAMAKMLWKKGDSEGARRVYRDGLYPPENYRSAFESSSDPWKSYAALCAQMGRVVESRQALEKAATLTRNAAAVRKRNDVEAEADRARSIAAENRTPTAIARHHAIEEAERRRVREEVARQRARDEAAQRVHAPGI